MPDLILHLQHIPLFASLPEPLLAELAQRAVKRHYTAGELIFLEGSQAEGYFYLAEGWIKVVKVSADGREQVLRFLGPGETFNEMGVFAQRPNPATAIALEPVTLWVIPRQALQAILATQPDAMLRILESMADRIVDLVNLVADLSLHTVETRLARLLLEQAEDTDVILRRRWSTQAEMAARLGTVPDVLSRALRNLAEDNIIRLERQQIQILDRERLSVKAQTTEI
ncbi:MAG: Crp/Fnr family transcriptional regulator [Caldilineaceae bacterium]|nr:Crp/Fnr family transcriptional regulator [Caldilineaceae bacterium]